ncbi:MAG: hypothetical protein WDM85_01425 [Caulobacteraceae bacterium]
MAFRALFGGTDRASPEHALRDYGVGAQILLDLGVREMILLTTREVRPAALDGYKPENRRLASRDRRGLSSCSKIPMLETRCGS